MLGKAIKEKMIKYNEMRQQVDSLQYEIENYLLDKYGIDENSICFVDGKMTKPYSMDGACPIYEWGTEHFDIEKIEDIVMFIKKFKKEFGEMPEISDVNNFFN